MNDDRPKASWLRVRPRFLIALGLIILGCWGAFQLYSWRYRAPMGKGPAGPAIPEEPFARTWHDGEVLLVGMGDSLVTGFGAPKGYGFFDLLVRNPKGDLPDMMGRNLNRVFPQLKVLNLAENSSTSGDHLRYQVPELDLQPKSVRGIVVLSTGGIDLIHDYGSTPPRDEAAYGASLEQGLRFAELFEGRLNRLMNELNRRFPGGVDVFVATILDPTDGVGDLDRVDPLLRLFKPLPPWPDGLKVLAAFNDRIRALAAARPNVHVVDVRGALLGHGLHCRDEKNRYYHPEDPTYWLYFNLEDPNRRGYDAIRRAYLLELVRVLGSRQPR